MTGSPGSRVRCARWRPSERVRCRAHPQCAIFDLALAAVLGLVGGGRGGLQFLRLLAEIADPRRWPGMTVERIPL